MDDDSKDMARRRRYRVDPITGFRYEKGSIMDMASTDFEESRRTNHHKKKWRKSRIDPITGMEYDEDSIIGRMEKPERARIHSEYSGGSGGIDLSSVPPIIALLFVITVGYVVLYVFLNIFASGIASLVLTLFQIALALGVMGIVGYAIYLLNQGQKQKVIDALKWLFTYPRKEDESHGTISPEKERIDVVPPLSTDEKNRIIVDIAHNKCEICEREDVLEVHHIKARAEGGRNIHDNLIVLCPTHHSMAGTKTIPASRLKYIVNHRR